MPVGSETLVEELLRQGNPYALDLLHGMAGPAVLRALAARWYADPRLASRGLLLHYLDGPVNAFHEPLVEVLLERAEREGDDEVLAAFLVYFDRSVRPQWRAGSPLSPAPSVPVPAATNMPRGQRIGCSYILPPEWCGWGRSRVLTLSESQRREYEAGRLFGLAARQSFRRRVWRYFRRLGRSHPERYVESLAGALRRYRPEDVITGPVLVSNRLLMRVLYFHRPCWRGRRWAVPDYPAPAFEHHWQRRPRVLFDLLREARSRPVRRWAMQLLRRQSKEVLAELSVEELLALLAEGDCDLVFAGVELLRSRGGVESVGWDRWMRLLKAQRGEPQEMIADLAGGIMGPGEWTLPRAVEWVSTCKPSASRGAWAWLLQQAPRDEADCRALLGLLGSEWEARLDPEVPAWVRRVVGASPAFRPEWVLAYFDSPDPAVRSLGWDWFRSEPRLRDDPALWSRLLDWRFQDVRTWMAEHLAGMRPEEVPDHLWTEPGKKVAPRLVAQALASLWRKPEAAKWVVRRLVGRLEWRPEEAPVLLPVLGLALKQARGPAWREGLAAAVRWGERHPEGADLLRQAVPELSW